MSQHSTNRPNNNSSNVKPVNTSNKPVGNPESSSNNLTPDSGFHIISPSNDNLRILYITFALIIGLLLVWIIIVVFTREDPIKILNDMTDLATQIKPATDLRVGSTITSSLQNSQLFQGSVASDTSQKYQVLQSASSDHSVPI